MASYPPPFPNDPRTQRQILRDQARLQRLHLRAMRRTSVVGPLALIAVGVLFLMVQIGRLPAASLWLWFARWWPLLLILVGFVRLFEWLLDRRAQASANGTPAPQRILGLGVVLLIAALVIAGGISSILRNKAGHRLGSNFEINQDNLEQFLGEKHESTQSLMAVCPSGTELVFDNPHGNVSVSGTSDDDQVHITLNNQIFARSDSEAARKEKQIGARLDRSGHQLRLSVPSVEGGRADVTISLPATASITGTVNRGDVQVHSLRGLVTLTVNHGDVDLSAITGRVTARINNGDSSLSAHSVTGDVTVEGRSLDLTLSDVTGSVSLNGDFFGTTHLERTSGAVRFHTSRTDLQFARLDGDLEISQSADLSATQIVGPVILNTRNRNISLERVSGPVSVTNRNGSVTLAIAQPISPVMIENRNGDIELTLPTDAQFSVQAETSNADLENDFGLSLTQEGDHPRLSGTIGAGGPLIQISTSQADISLHKGSVSPLPPRPPIPPQLSAEPADAVRDRPEPPRGLRHSK